MHEARDMCAEVFAAGCFALVDSEGGLYVFPRERFPERIREKLIADEGRLALALRDFCLAQLMNDSNTLR